MWWGGKQEHLRREEDHVDRESWRKIDNSIQLTIVRMGFNGGL